MTSAVAPLRIGSFRAIWFASVFSAIGTFVQSVSGSWLMLELTGSNAWVGLMVSSSMLPLLFLSLAAGALADMFDRAKVMLVAQAVMGTSALAMAVLTATGMITPGLLLALGVVLGVGVTLNLPAWQALVPDMVPRGMVASAVALNSAAFNVARAVGPAIGGALIVAFGAEAGFLVNSLSYLAVIVGLLAIGGSLDRGEREPSSIGYAMTLGLRYARFTPSFRRLLAMVSLFAITSAVVQAVLPNHTVALGGQAGSYGLLLGSMGAGALVGALIRTRVVGLLNRRTVPINITLFGLSGIALSAAPNLFLAGTALFAAGVFWVLALANLNATAQLMTPSWIRGRAMALYTLAFGGMIPVGAILSGVLADAVGTSRAIALFSLAGIALGFLAPRFRIPSVDEVESPEFSDDRPAPSHDETLEGGPVLVLNSWQIDLEDLTEFTSVMEEVRRVRLSTGAYRWRLLRHTSDPRRITELFAVASWEEHLHQHRRIDDASAALIMKARAFDSSGGPVTQHLIDIDLDNPPDFDALLAVHAELHRTDGSIPDLG